MINPEYCEIDDDGKHLTIGFTNEEAKPVMELHLTFANAAKLSFMIRNHVSYAAQKKREKIESGILFDITAGF